MLFVTVEAVYKVRPVVTLEILLYVIQVFSGFISNVCHFISFPNLSNGFVADVMLAIMFSLYVCA